MFKKKGSVIHLSKAGVLKVGNTTPLGAMTIFLYFEF